MAGGSITRPSLVVGDAKPDSAIQAIEATIELLWQPAAQMVHFGTRPPFHQTPKGTIKVNKKHKNLRLMLEL